MSALFAAAGLVLLTAALCALGVANVLAHRRTRRLIATYKALVAAKDEQLEAYAHLIAGQEGLIATQTQLIRAHEKRAVTLGLPPRSPGSWGAPLQ
ncbi:hypothetical protein [Methylobacterium sp. J-070]|uniref:hypothetical protein n=1 Tax=Methylobacterium sp. J-070 TaxID=2836650 RepID=UPI001FBB753E|nr:hypothetical protein [Methylobacterium sp. J-070]MCJ2051667.1 hypothetical protein [Methylobacterium sp. J-070]